MVRFYIVVPCFKSPFYSQARLDLNIGREAVHALPFLAGVGRQRRSRPPCRDFLGNQRDGPANREASVFWESPPGILVGGSA